jgi:hypothetical protein
MEIDHQSLYGLHSCTHWLRPRNPPPPPPYIPPHLGSYTRTLLVSQDRRHLLMTPLVLPFRIRFFSTLYYLNVQIKFLYVNQVERLILQTGKQPNELRILSFRFRVSKSSQIRNIEIFFVVQYIKNLNAI